MRCIAVEYAPARLLRVPSVERLHQVTHLRGALAIAEGPATPPCIHLIGGAQRAQAARLLRLLLHESPRRREAVATVGRDRHRLDSEAPQHPVAGPMGPEPADARQARGAARRVADARALDAPTASPPWPRTRRRGSRLMALTTRGLLRDGRRWASAHRPQGTPTS